VSDKKHLPRNKGTFSLCISKTNRQSTTAAEWKTELISNCTFKKNINFQGSAPFVGKNFVP